MESINSTSLKSSDLDELEARLLSFEQQWQMDQDNYSILWRRLFLGSALPVAYFCMPEANHWWILMVLLLGFLGAILGVLYNKNKTENKIKENRRQLDLARFLYELEEQARS